MAVMMISNDFLAADPDFNAVYETTPTINLQGSGGLPIGMPPVSLGGRMYAVPTAMLTVTEVLQIDGTNLDMIVGGSSLAADGAGSLTSGDITIIAQGGLGLDWYLLGITTDYTEFNTIAQSNDTADDLAFFTDQLAGNDLIILTETANSVDAGMGRDLIMDMGGSDTILAGMGKDVVLSRKGADEIDGGAGNDLLLGGAGRDSIIGGYGDDVLVGQGGGDVLTGGGAADMFVFGVNDGVDHITDFVSGLDKILLIGNAAELANVQMTQNGDDVWVTFLESTVILDDTLLEDVSMGDVTSGGNHAIKDAAHELFHNWAYV